MKKIAIDVLEFSKPYLSLHKILKIRGYDLVPIDKLDLDDSEIELYIFIYPQYRNYIDQLLKLGKKDKMVCALVEPPVVHPEIYNHDFHENFKRVFTWDDDLVDRKKYFKYYYANSLLRPHKQRVKFSKRKLATIISARKYSHVSKELYSERERAIKFFEQNHPDDFDLYGRLWETPLNFKEKVLGVTRWPSYKGEIPDKLEVLSGYKFNICYENMGEVKGYITEKPLESIEAECVPVYLGASNVTEYIPKEVFVDKRDFSTYEDLYNFLKNMNEGTYLKYIEAGRKFLRSKQASYWFEDGWAKHLVRQLPLKKI